MMEDFSNLGSSLLEEEIMEPLQERQVEISGGVVRYPLGKDHDFYMYPKDDAELLEWCGRRNGRPSRRWNCVDRFLRPEVYGVKVEADNCTVEGCLELLKGIGCESRFIAFSVDIAGLFLAELNKEEADKLEGLGGIFYVVRHVEREFQCF